MAIILRQVKGSELTILELDNNFSELDQRINEKENISHTHTIGNINGLQDALDDKIDMGNTNVAGGLLLLDSNAKVPCSFLNDCFDVASKVSTSDLFDTGGIIKAELLPTSSGSGGGGNCDCAQIEADILDLQNTRATKLKIVRRITANSESLATDEEIIIINDLIESFDISQNVTEGRVVKLRRIGGTNVQFGIDVNFITGNLGNTWTGVMGNTIELVYFENNWIQIG